MKLTFLGHAGISLDFEAAGQAHSLVVDPFVTGNPSTPVSLSALQPTYVLVTHAHGDHWGDVPALAERTGATVIGTAEIATYAGGLGLNAHGMNVGGTHTFPFGKVRLTPAWHSSSFPDGAYGGMPTGIVLDVAGHRIYHAGDTALFSDMRLIGDLGLDLALLPIGDNYTMGPTDALEAVKLLRPRYVMPIHFGTFPLLAQDAAGFKQRVESETSARGLVLEPGEVSQLSTLFAAA
ncbi:MAG: metal-dependent hydrolase [Trueperaceae bacterium]|jgi:L-ascorbate metabolism protein UlaG (beta-lactamase superfamily)